MEFEHKFLIPGLQTLPIEIHFLVFSVWENVKLPWILVCIQKQEGIYLDRCVCDTYVHVHARTDTYGARADNNQCGDVHPPKCVEMHQLICRCVSVDLPMCRCVDVYQSMCWGVSVNVPMCFRLWWTSYTRMHSRPTLSYRY